MATLLMGGIADAFVDPLDSSCRNATKGAVPCASEVQGQLVGFQVGMLMATVAIIAVTGAVICQMRLATQGASPKCLAWIKYAAPSESPEEESRASSSGTALRYVKWRLILRLLSKLDYCKLTLIFSSFILF